MPDLKSMRHFIHLSETLHFGRSSESLHVSPSTLSRSISRLEQDVGAALFVRDNRSVSLTDAGNRFRGFASQTLTAWADLRSELLTSPGELVGRIRIYCSVTASYSFMSTILTEFRQQYPGVEVTLKTGDASFAIEKVLDLSVDLAIAPKPDFLPGQINFQSIVETPLCFIAPAIKCPVNEMVMSNKFNWAEAPLILPEFGLSRKRIDAWFKKNSLKPKIQAEVMGHEAIVSMVGLGMGIGVVPELVIDSSPISNKILRMDDAPELQQYNVGIVVLDRKLSDPVTQSFWQVAGRVSGGIKVTK